MDHIAASKSLLATQQLAPLRGSRGGFQNILLGVAETADARTTRNTEGFLIRQAAQEGKTMKAISTSPYGANRYQRRATHK